MLTLQVIARAVFLVLVAAPLSRSAIGPSTDLKIVNANISPDGVARTAVLANGVFPGPIIRGNKGDTFQINVINQLTDESMLAATSIHWHGMHHRSTPWADGAAYITQCPIGPGKSFLYSFGNPDQAGTFWYHSHLSTQYCDGLRGPLIIYDPSDPHLGLYDVDDDSTVLTLADWYHDPSQTRADRYPFPNSVLINGLGRTPSTLSAPLATINVSQGRRYRIRLLNIACDPHFIFSVDSHNFTVIEVDGVNVTPVVVDSITIYASQRYSVILTASAPAGNYWIRAYPFKGPSGFAGGINSAVLHYDAAPIAEPSPIDPPPPHSTPLDESNLTPLVPDVLGIPDMRVNLEFAHDPDKDIFAVNGVSFLPPSVPALLQILSGTRDPKEILPEGSVFPLGTGVVEMSMPGGLIRGPHPFHLHGHTFSVIRSAGSTVYNTENPIRRDTVNIGNEGDNVTIRFRTDNPGPWLLHCHIDWHLEGGLAIMFAENIPDVPQADSVPAAWKALCPDYMNVNLTSSPSQPSNKHTGGCSNLKTPSLALRWVGGLVVLASVLV